MIANQTKCPLRGESATANCGTIFDDEPTCGPRNGRANDMVREDVHSPLVSCRGTQDAFGKHGKRISQVPMSYLKWLSQMSSFGAG